MKVCNVERLPSGIEVWHYQRQVEYLVRQINVCEDGQKSYLVKSPSGKLYQFDCVEDNPEKLIERIEDGKAEGKMYESLYQSIYDETSDCH